MMSKSKLLPTPAVVTPAYRPLSVHNHFVIKILVSFLCGNFWHRTDSNGFLSPLHPLLKIFHCFRILACYFTKIVQCTTSDQSTVSVIQANQSTKFLLICWFKSLNQILKLTWTCNGIWQPYIFSIEPLSKTGYYWLGVCHGWFHLHCLTRAALNAKQARITKWKFLPPAELKLKTYGLWSHNNINLANNIW